MPPILSALRAIAEPTRLRLLAVLAHGERTVSELTEVLAQSQPRLSRHLKLLVDTGLLERHPEGAWVFFRLTRDGAAAELRRAVLALLDADELGGAGDMERLERLKRRQLEAAFHEICVDQNLFELLGPAVNSGAGMFLYGAPGNGKSTLAQRITMCFGQEIWVPHAIMDDGHLIKLFDASYHATVDADSSGLLKSHEYDKRWIKVRRPTVVVGGELTMDSLVNIPGTFAGLHLLKPSQAGVSRKVSSLSGWTQTLSSE